MTQVLIYSTISQFSLYLVPAQYYDIIDKDNLKLLF